MKKQIVFIKKMFYGKNIREKDLSIKESPSGEGQAFGWLLFSPCPSGAGHFRSGGIRLRAGAEPGTTAVEGLPSYSEITKMC